MRLSEGWIVRPNIYVLNVGPKVSRISRYIECFVLFYLNFGFQSSGKSPAFNEFLGELSLLSKAEKDKFLADLSNTPKRQLFRKNGSSDGDESNKRARVDNNVEENSEKAMFSSKQVSSMLTILVLNSSFNFVSDRLQNLNIL